MVKYTLSELLEDRNITMYAVSRATGISPNNISAICNNKTKSISLETIQKLCFFLKCNVSDLITYIEN